MYNEEQKRRFISDHYQDGNTDYATKFFHRLGKYEEEYNCDVAAMAQGTADSVFSKVCGAGKSSIAHNRSVLRAYLKWCQGNGIATVVDAKALKIDVSERFQNEYVCSPSHLKHTIDYLFSNPGDAEFLYVLRSYLWLAFMGLDSSEAIQVTSRNLDFKKMVLTLDHSAWRKYSIYDESVKDLRMASGLTSFRSPAPHGSFIQRDRAPGDLILRRSPRKNGSQDVSVLELRNKYSKIAKDARDAAAAEGLNLQGVSLNVTYETAYESGIFYRMFEDERNGITPNFEKYVAIDFERRTGKKPSSEMSFNDIRAQYELRGAYTDKYLRWKQTFEKMLEPKDAQTDVKKSVLKYDAADVLAFCKRNCPEHIYMVKRGDYRVNIYGIEMYLKSLKEQDD